MNLYLTGITRNSIYIWLLGFFSLLSAANVVNAIIMWFSTGPTSTFNSFLIGGLTIPVYVYTLISILATVAFLGGASYLIMKNLSVVDQVGLLGEQLNSLQTNQETQRVSIMDLQDKTSKIDESINQTGSKLSSELSSQGDALKKSWTAGQKAIDDKTSKLQASQESQQQALKAVQSEVSEVNENLELTGKKLSEEFTSQGEAIKLAVEAGGQNQQKLIDGVQGRMLFVDESLKDIKTELGEQAAFMKTIDTNIAKNVNSQLTDVKETVAKLKATDDKTVAAITRQKEEISEIRQKLERLEASLLTPNSMLKSDSNIEDIKGIGPNKATELKNAGIISASDFIMADPKVVAQSMGSTEKTVEKLQGRAQLQMVPGIKEKDLSFLEELDITDRSKLSTQDPIDLGRKINAIFKERLAKGKAAENDRPTIEEVTSWIKYTKG